MKNKAIVIGAGIMGMATARALAEKGWSVQVFEKTSRPLGASIRNFGMIWPIGQPAGVFYEWAIRSREIWKEICNNSNNWYNQSGSIHVSQNQLESLVMEEVAAAYSSSRPLQWLSREQILKRFPAINPIYCQGGLWSCDEMIIESREIMNSLPDYFLYKYNIHTFFNQTVTEIGKGYIKIDSHKIEADVIFLCNGSDFESLFPRLFNEHFYRCKLQMLRVVGQPENYSIGPSVCGGLSLIHYKAFLVANSLSKLKNYYEVNCDQYLKHGIHVMVSQNYKYELTIGDSHEYGIDFSPFDSNYINNLIIEYLKNILVAKDWSIIQTWNGIYSKLQDGKTGFFQEVEKDVWVMNGLGGAGMTLSFAFAEDCIENILF